MKSIFKLFFLIAGLGLLACQETETTTPVTTSVNSQTIYLVRHAEKQKGDDPELTEEGIIRAGVLRDLLLDKDIRHIHSSDYRRTWATAAPLAEALDLEVQIYNARDLPGIGKAVRELKGNQLVVGHSNTTPELATIISGQPHKAMPETEYNRLTYIQISGEDGKMESTVLTFDPE